MKGLSGLVVNQLRPVLDTYLNAAVTVVGCRAEGFNRNACELDVVLVTNEIRPPVAIRSGDALFDLYFMTEKEALRPRNPEVAVALAHSKPVRDTNLILSTSVAANQAVFEVEARRSAQHRLTACLKSLGRSGESLVLGNSRAASYWLMSGAYDFAYAWLYSQEVAPSPSHLLWQLRGTAKGSPKSFESFSNGAGLTDASRRGCLARLEGLSLLYDLVKTRRSAIGPPGTISTDVSFQIVKRKADQLAEEIEHAESYSFLGIEVIYLLAAVSKSGDRSSLSQAGRRTLQGVLSEGGPKLLGDRLVHDLGLDRPRDEVKDSLSSLQRRVSTLARRI